MGRAIKNGDGDVGVLFTGRWLLLMELESPKDIYTHARGSSNGNKFICHMGVTGVLPVYRVPASIVCRE